MTAPPPAIAGGDEDVLFRLSLLCKPGASFPPSIAVCQHRRSHHITLRLPLARCRVPKSHPLPTAAQKNPAVISSRPVLCLFFTSSDRQWSPPGGHHLRWLGTSAAVATIWRLCLKSMQVPLRQKGGHLWEDSSVLVLCLIREARRSVLALRNGLSCLPLCSSHAAPQRPWAWWGGVKPWFLAEVTLVQHYHGPRDG